MARKPNLEALFGESSAKTFLGLPSCDDLSLLDAQIAIIGAPCATPYKSVGAYCANGPEGIRKGMSAFTANFAHHDFDAGGAILPHGIKAVDHGDLAFDEDNAAGNRETIRKAVCQVLEKNAVPIVLGGDDSIPIPMLEAFAGRGQFTILQIDAHIDWRDSHEGERMGLSSTMRRASEMEHIETIVQVGQRGLGSARPGDVEDAKNWGAKLIPAKDICANGVDAALGFIAPGSKVIVCMDCDGMDPSVMPGVIGRAPGGLSYWHIIELLEGVARKAEIAAMDLVEFMPERDIDGLGALTAGRIVVTTMALIARQSTKNS